MITSCSMYAIRINGVLNVPFVAINDDQAIEIVCNAIDQESYLGEFDLVKIGSFDVYKGVDYCDHSVVKIFNDSFSEVQNEVQESV